MRRGGTASEPTLHNRLAVLRAERGFSRADLAAAVGVNPQTVGFLERGDYGPSLVLALQLSRVFDLPVEAMFSLDPFFPLSAQIYRRPDAGTPAPTAEETS